MRLSSFRPIPGFDKRYIMNAAGEIRGVCRRSIKLPPKNGEKLQVRLYDGERYVSYNIRTLLRETFPERTAPKYPHIFTGRLYHQDRYGLPANQILDEVPSH